MVKASVLGFMGEWVVIRPEIEQEFWGTMVTPNNLILTSEESPILFHDPAVAIAYFVEDYIHFGDLPENIGGLTNKWSNDKNISLVLENPFNYMQYGFSGALQFYDLVKTAHTLKNPPGKGWDFERWLLSNMGELALFCMRHIEGVEYIIKNYRGLLANINNPLFANFTAMPYGYPGTEGFKNIVEKERETGRIVQQEVQQNGRGLFGVFKRGA